MAFTDDHRNIEPAVYNTRRLNESPIPLPAHQFDSNVAIEDSFNSEVAETSGNNSGEMSMVNFSDLSAQSTINDHVNTTSDGDGIGNGTLNSIENVSIENDHGNDSNELFNASVHDEEVITEDDSNLANTNQYECDPLAVSTEFTDRPENETISDENEVLGDAAELSNAQVINGLATAQTEASQIGITDNSGDSDARAVVKVEPLPVYDNHVANDNDIDDVLDEPIVDVHDDDIVIVIGRSGFPKPLGMTAEQNIKRENDKMSGNMTYSVSVRMHLIHKEYYNRNELYQLKLYCTYF